jgi:hypothetical protein
VEEQSNEFLELQAHTCFKISIVPLLFFLTNHLFCACDVPILYMHKFDKLMDNFWTKIELLILAHG